MPHRTTKKNNKNEIKKEDHIFLTLRMGGEHCVLYFHVLFYLFIYYLISHSCEIYSTENGEREREE
jgi:hypothetical protein